MNDTVDILIATYNGETYLREQLDSLIGQTYPHIRLIASDDGSTDGTLPILEEYAKKYPHFTYTQNPENQGFIRNFAGLLSKVESPYFMFCDQDDVWGPQKIEKSLAKLKSEGADLVFTDLTVVDKELNVLYSSMVNIGQNRYFARKYTDYRMVYLRNIVTGCTILSRKEKIKDILPISDVFPMVHDWWVALMAGQTGRIAFLDESTVQYRQHSGNQIGVYGFTGKSFGEYRAHYISLRIGQFRVYTQNNDRFLLPLQVLNDQALQYFIHMERVRRFSLRHISLFCRIYQTEQFRQKCKQFLVLHFPAVGRLLFTLKHKVTVS